MVLGADQDWTNPTLFVRVEALKLPTRWYDDWHRDLPFRARCVTSELFVYAPFRVRSAGLARISLAHRFSHLRHKPEVVSPRPVLVADDFLRHDVLVGVDALGGRLPRNGLQDAAEVPPLDPERLTGFRFRKPVRGVTEQLEESPLLGGEALSVLGEAIGKGRRPAYPIKLREGRKDGFQVLPGLSFDNRIAVLNFKE